MFLTLFLYGCTLVAMNKHILIWFILFENEIAGAAVIAEWEKRRLIAQITWVCRFILKVTLILKFLIDTTLVQVMQKWSWTRSIVIHLVLQIIFLQFSTKLRIFRRTFYNMVCDIYKQTLLKYSEVSEQCWIINLVYCIMGQ